MRREAAFRWMMPLEAARSSVLSAAWTDCAADASPCAMASRAFFTAERSPVRTAVFRVRRLWVCRLRFSAERVFANGISRKGLLESGVVYRPWRSESSVTTGREHSGPCSADPCATGARRERARPGLRRRGSARQVVRGALSQAVPSRTCVARPHRVRVWQFGDAGSYPPPAILERNERRPPGCDIRRSTKKYEQHAELIQVSP